MSLGGRAVILYALGLPLAAMSGRWFLWWTLAVTVAVLLDALAAPSLRHVSIDRVPVPPLTLGDATEATTVVRLTRGRRIRGRLRDLWQPSAGATADVQDVRLAVDTPVTLITPLRPRRRGDVRAEAVAVRSRGPLGLAYRQRTIDAPAAVRVLPPFRSRSHLPGLVHSLRIAEGKATARVRGRGTEFDSLREYAHGDDVRSIDWRATARHRSTVVRTWRPERDRHVVIVLDTSRTSAGRIDDMPRLEWSMEAAQLLAALTHQAGDRVTVLTGNGADVGVVTARAHGDISQPLAHHLATIEPSLAEADWMELGTAVLTRIPHRALVVLLTDASPAAVREGMLPLLPRLTSKYHVVVASMVNPQLAAQASLPASTLVPRRATLARVGSRAVGGNAVVDASLPPVTSPEEAYAAAAAEAEIHGRDLARDALAKVRVTTIETLPSELPTAVCEYYLAAKQQGRL